MKLKDLFFILLLILTISACGDKDNNDSSVPVLKSLSGKVMVGSSYLKNAKSCLDIDNNARCDETDIQTQSDNNGNYRFTEIPEDVYNTTPLIAEISNNTVNVLSGKSITKPFIISAPAKSTIISPLTTLVHQLVESGKEINEAKKDIKQRLNTSLDLETDYIVAEATSEPNNASDARHIRSVAHIIAVNLANGFEAVSATSSQSIEQQKVSLPDDVSLTVEELMSFLASKQMKSMDAISKAAFQFDNNGRDFNSDTIKASPILHQAMNPFPSESNSNINRQRMADLLTMIKKQSASQAIDVNELLTSPLYSMSFIYNTPAPAAQIESFILDISTNNLVHEVSKWSFDSSTFSAPVSPEAHHFLVYAEGNWSRPNNQYQKATNNAENSLLLVNKTMPTLSIEITANEYALGGTPIQSPFVGDPMLRFFPNMLNDNTKFGDGAKGIETNITAKNSVLKVNKKFDCTEPETPTLETTCFRPFMLKQAEETYTLFPTELSQLISNQPSEGNLNLLTGPIVAQDGNEYIVAELLPIPSQQSSGEVNYYLVQQGFQNESEPTFKASTQLFAKGRWNENTSPSEPDSIINLNLPANVMAVDNSGFAKRHNIYIELEGRVRQGNKLLAGQRLPSPKLILNNQAKSDVISNLATKEFDFVDAGLFLDLQLPRCVTGDTFNDSDSELNFSTDKDYALAVKKCTDFMITTNHKKQPGFKTLGPVLISARPNGEVARSFFTESLLSEQWQPVLWGEFVDAKPTQRLAHWRVDNNNRSQIEIRDDNQPIERLTMSLVNRKEGVISVKTFHEKQVWGAIDGTKGRISSNLYQIITFDDSKRLTIKKAAD
ncbi:hypothetical protein [Parashewanella tropica]|uniref:hypothetical protein n=1 Tax=Parashewanella tropica TaxID=2547970 RepID=UPI00105A6AE4|nr:hypothetical protein [Parashewanella tropica]